jgi:hypothetical protein
MTAKAVRALKRARKVARRGAFQTAQSSFAGRAEDRESPAQRFDSFAAKSRIIPGFNEKKPARSWARHNCRIGESSAQFDRSTSRRSFLARPTIRSGAICVKERRRIRHQATES